jgi:hypothetical protein
VTKHNDATAAITSPVSRSEVPIEVHKTFPAALKENTRKLLKRRNIIWEIYAFYFVSCLSDFRKKFNIKINVVLSYPILLIVAI